MAFTTNPAATMTFTQGSKTVTVSGTNPLLEDVVIGDFALDPSGLALPVASVAAGSMTLVRNAPGSGTVVFDIMWGPGRGLVQQTTATTRSVWAQINAWADRGLSIPVTGISNGPPSTPADGERYLVGTSAAGAWVGKSNTFATWSGTADEWLFTTPEAGWSAVVVGGGLFLVFSGSNWLSIQSAAADILYTPGSGSGIAATDVQGALTELGTRFNFFREKLTANRAYHVNPLTGNDSTGTGSAGAPWATKQKAANWIYDNLDTNGYIVEVNLPAGSYSSGVVMDKPLVGGGYILWKGPSSGPDYAVVTANTCFEAWFGARAVVQGRVRIVATSIGIMGIAGGIIEWSGIDFGAQGAGGIHAYANRFGTAAAIGAYTISGSGGANHFQASHHGNLRHSAGAATFTANATFTAGVFYALAEADITITGSASYSLGSFTVTGTKFIADAATIQWAGATPDSIPGSAAGIEQNGGRFINGLANETFTGTTTYDLASASGTTITITGLGHIPGQISLDLNIDNGNSSEGVSIRSNQNCTGYIGPAAFTSDIHAGIIFVDGANYVAFAVTARAFNSFTLTATKVGTPTGSLRVRFTTRRGI